MIESLEVSLNVLHTIPDIYFCLSYKFPSFPEIYLLYIIIVTSTIYPYYYNACLSISLLV